MTIPYKISRLSDDCYKIALYMTIPYKIPRPSDDCYKIAKQIKTPELPLSRQYKSNFKALVLFKLSKLL